MEGDFGEARDIKQALQHAGARVIGPYHDQPFLPCVTDTDFLCAIVGFDVQGGAHEEIVNALHERGIPIVMLSEPTRQIPERLLGCSVLQKPVDLYALLKLVAKIAVGEGTPCLDLS
jgi:hypothetical protein